VRVTPAPLWLNGKKDGAAVSSLAPPQVFEIATGRTAVVRTVLGRFRVTAVGRVGTLGSQPFDAVRPAIRTALATFSRGDAFERWLESRENAALRTAVCRRDELPKVGSVDLAALAPFLTVTG
jgi:hypothetical protein